MGIRESLLNTITSVSNGDFIRIVTSAGASSKATVANLFKSFESGLGAKSNLGTSDYVRVVGSDNVSYKQQVSNVASVAVEKAYLTPPTALSSGADLLTLAVGVYYAPSNDVAASLVNKPSGLSSNCRVEVLSRIPTRKEIIVTDLSNNVWENQMDSASTWAGWEKRPTRTEMNTLNTKTTVQDGNALSSFDLNNLKDTTIYQFDKLTSVMTNAPNTGTYFSGFLFVEKYAANKVLQTFYYTGGESAIYVRSLWNGTWGSWYKMPTRGEVDALNKKIYYNHSSATSYAVPVDGWVSGNYHTFVMYGGTSSTNPFMYLGWISESGDVAFTPIKADTGRTYTGTLDTSSKVLTITASGTVWGGITVITG